MKKYDGKLAVIIGGTSGMGLATAKMLLEEGARVLVTGRSQAGLESAEQELGGSAVVVSSDARSLTDIDALATRVKGEFGTFDLLFVNAGFSIPTPLDSVTEAIYDEMFNLNAKGPFFAVQKLAPLINRGAQLSSRPPSPTSRDCTYSATKAALRSFARTWTSEFKDRGIRTNVLSPGPVDTPMFDDQFPSKEGAAEARKQITAMTPLARLARPEEIACAALFLASDQSSYVAGIDLPVDGGLTAV